MAKVAKADKKSAGSKKKGGEAEKLAAASASALEPAPASAPSGRWTEHPAEHDYPAAAAFLSLVCEPTEVRKLVTALKGAPIVHHQAKDLLRASGLGLLPADNVHVASDLAKLGRGERLSPVLLVRGDVRRGVALTIADGYHRICASYHVDENADIPCHLVDYKGPSPVTGFRQRSGTNTGGAPRAPAPVRGPDSSQGPPTAPGPGVTSTPQPVPGPTPTPGDNTGPVPGDNTGPVPGQATRPAAREDR